MGRPSDGLLYIDCLASNEMLKLKFREMHSTIVSRIHPTQVAYLINFLFQDGVVTARQTRDLQGIKDDPQKQTSEFLTLLHLSENRQAFVKLYAAINGESELQWLNNRIVFQSQPSLQYRSNR